MIRGDRLLDKRMRDVSLDCETMKDKMPANFTCPQSDCGGRINERGLCSVCGLDVATCAEWLDYLAMAMMSDDE